MDIIIMGIINIHISISTENKWVQALGIPREDIKKFSHRPLKWLRFVCFAVFGTKGNLQRLGDSGNNPVDYDIDSVTDLAENYYFFPDGECRLVDSPGLGDRITATAKTPRRLDFRKAVARRDGNRCVITSSDADECDAAHIIPHSKGDQYIHFVISDRESLYGPEPESGIAVDIDSMENGVFLRKDLHRRYGLGKSAFLKTPNFALDTTDIPRVESGEMPASRTTLQHIVPSSGLEAVLQRDVQPDWSVQDAPLSILLDYVYGIAAVNQWGTNDIWKSPLNRRDTYATVLSNTSSLPENGDNDADIPAKPVRSDDSKYVPSDSEPESNPLSEAMDVAMALSMLVKGYPRGTTFTTICQRKEEEAEMRSRQATREKVQGWLETSESFPLIHASDSVVEADTMTPIDDDFGGM